MILAMPDRHKNVTLDLAYRTIQKVKQQLTKACKVNRSCYYRDTQYLHAVVTESLLQKK